MPGMVRGYGRVLAESFAAEGAKVVGCDIDADAAALSRSALGLRSLQDTHGRLDCAVNNAGTEPTGMIADAQADVVARLICVERQGVRYCVNIAASS